LITNISSTETSLKIALQLQSVLHYGDIFWRTLVRKWQNWTRVWTRYAVQCTI